MTQVKWIFRGYCHYAFPREIRDFQGNLKMPIRVYSRNAHRAENGVFEDPKKILLLGDNTLYKKKGLEYSKRGIKKCHEEGEL